MPIAVCRRVGYGGHVHPGTVSVLLGTRPGYFFDCCCSRADEGSRQSGSCISPIQLPVADRLSQVRGLDTLATRQIRNRARHPQNPVHRTC